MEYGSICWIGAGHPTPMARWTTPRFTHLACDGFDASTALAHAERLGPLHEWLNPAGIRNRADASTMRQTDAAEEA
jgi:hypothetical protein